MSITSQEINVPFLGDGSFDGTVAVASVAGLPVGATAVARAPGFPDRVGKINDISGLRLTIVDLTPAARPLDLSAYRAGAGANLLVPSQATSSVPAPAETAVAVDQAYDGTASYQPVAADLELGATAGKNHPSTAFLAPVMGNVHDNGAVLTKTGNYVAGVIGEYSIAGVRGSHYPTAGVLAQVGDGAGRPRGAVVASIDGDSGAVLADAMFAVMCQNSAAGSGADFGVDLQDAAHDGYIAVDAAFYKKAPLRLVSDVVTLVGSATPVDGTTGAAVAGPGSDYRCTGTPGIYINVNTKASPTWKLITHA